MENKKIYDDLFLECFGVEASQLNAELTYQSVDS